MLWESRSAMATKQLEKYGSYREEARSRRKVYLSPLLNQGSDDPLMLTVTNVPDGTGEVPEVVRKRLEKVMIPAWLKKIKPLESALDSLLLESMPPFSSLPLSFLSLSRSIS